MRSMATGSADSIVRKKTTFMSSYIDTCKALNCHPLSSIKVRLPNRVLEISVDRIKLVDWQPLLKTISEDKSLHLLSIKSRQSLSSYLGHLNTESKVHDLKKVPVLFTGYMMGCLTESLSKCLTSKSLSVLELHQIPLDKDTVKQLCKGLSRNSSIQHFSLQYTLIGDEGCEELCRVIRSRPNILSLTLIDCNLTSKGAYHISQLIKNQEMARFSESWKHTLRYRVLDHNRLPGLRRVTLNHNPKIGDNGIDYIVDIMMDDLWIKAIDMQDCGISECSFDKVYNLVKSNIGILIFDIRDNDLPMDKIGMIFECLIYNTENDPSDEYYWMEERMCDVSSTSGSTVSNQTKTLGSVTNLPLSRKREMKSNTTIHPSLHSQKPSVTSVYRSMIQKKVQPLQKKNGVSTINGLKKSLDDIPVNSKVISSSSDSSSVSTRSSETDTKTAKRTNRVISSPVRLCRSAVIKMNHPKVKDRPVKKGISSCRDLVSNTEKYSCSENNSVKKEPTRKNGLKKASNKTNTDGIGTHMNGLILGKGHSANGFKKSAAQNMLNAGGDHSVQLIRGIKNVMGPHHAENAFWSRIRNGICKSSDQNCTDGSAETVPNRIFEVRYHERRYSPNSILFNQNGFMEKNNFKNDRSLENGNQ